MNGTHAVTKQHASRIRKGSGPAIMIDEYFSSCSSVSSVAKR